MHNFSRHHAWSFMIEGFSLIFQVPESLKQLFLSTFKIPIGKHKTIYANPFILVVYMKSHPSLLKLHFYTKSKSMMALLMGIQKVKPTKPTLKELKPKKKTTREKWKDGEKIGKNIAIGLIILFLLLYIIQ